MKKILRLLGISTTALLSAALSQNAYADVCDDWSGTTTVNPVSLEFCKIFLAKEQIDLENYQFDYTDHVWKSPRLLRAYIEMYETTGQIYFLNRFTELADILVASGQGNVPGYLKTGNDTNDWYHRHVVQSANVAIPLSRFHRITENWPNISSNDPSFNNQTYLNQRGKVYHAHSRCLTAHHIENTLQKSADITGYSASLYRCIDTESTDGNANYASIDFQKIPSRKDRFCLNGSQTCGQGNDGSNGIHGFMDTNSAWSFFYVDYNDPSSRSDLIGYGLPINQQLMMATNLIHLSQISNPDEFQIDTFANLRKRLGRIFRYHAKESAETDEYIHDEYNQYGTYNWTYNWGEALTKTNKAEDGKHAAIDIEFIIEAYNAGINLGNSGSIFPVKALSCNSTDTDCLGFDDRVMKRFTNTFTEELFDPSKFLSFSTRVDGSDGAPGEKFKTRAQVGSFLDLAQWDQDIDFSDTSVTLQETDFVPNKVYSIAKCTFLHHPAISNVSSETYDDDPYGLADFDLDFKTINDYRTTHGFAMLTKWAQNLEDSDGFDVANVGFSTQGLDDRCYSLNPIDVTDGSALDDFYLEYLRRTSSN